MRLLPKSIRNLTPVALALGFSLTAVYADGPIGAGKKIQFSDPDAGSSQAEANLRATPDESTFKRIKGDIFGPLQNMVPDHPLDPVLDLPPPRNPAPPVISKHTRQLLEQRKNWAFMSMEDFAGNSSAEEMMGINQYGPDGREKQNLTPIEKFYKDLDKSHTLTARQMSEALRGMQNPEFSGTNTYNPLNFAFSGTNMALAGSVSPAMRPGQTEENGSRFDQSPILRPSFEQTEDVNRRFQQFQQILDPHAANQAQNGGVDGYGFPNQTSGHGRTPSSLYEIHPAATTPQAIRPEAISYAGVSDPSLLATHSHAFDNVTARALGVTNSFIATRQVEPPKTEYQNPFDQFNKSFKSKF